jgi:hypothetical protein
MINTTITVENHTTQRQMFVAAVKRLAYEKEQSIAQTYKYIYKIINNNLKINIQVRAKHRNCKPIDVLEQDNLLEYALRIVNNELNKVA